MLLSHTLVLDKVATSGYIEVVRSVGIKALKNQLSKYVRLASEGEVILVTDRDRVVAELTMPRAGRAERIEDAQLAEAIREGWLTPPAVRKPLPERAPIGNMKEMLDELDAARSER